MPSPNLHTIASTTLSASTEPKPAAPAWLAQLTIFARVWSQSGLLDRLNARVHVTRGRAGSYEVCDFVLLMLGYAISAMSSFKHFHMRLAPFAPAVASLWNRDATPSPSAISRFLTDVDDDALDSLRDLLVEDILLHGPGPQMAGGLLTRTGERFIVFDADPTVKAARQRALVDNERYPPPRRRRTKVCAPGYVGRKRGQVVRSRLTLQQAHTGQWLGSWASAGNGDRWGDLAMAASTARRYLDHHGLQQGVMRLDGAYGFAYGPSILGEHNIEYVVRCSDYRLLEHKTVVDVIEHQIPVVMTQPCTSTTRHIFDAGWLWWKAGGDSKIRVQTRLLITRRPHKGTSKPAVGKLIDGWAWELFATSLDDKGLSPSDVVDLYFGRGGFESTLAMEDQECDPGRWLSNDPKGQTFWQLICQHVWNSRLRVGLLTDTDSLRRTMRAAPAAQQDLADPSGQLIPLRGRTSRQRGPTRYFECLAGVQLPEDTSSTNSEYRFFTADGELCRDCEHRAPCVMEDYMSDDGKSVVISHTFINRSEATWPWSVSPSIGKQALWWVDLPARRLRTDWCSALENQQVEVSAQQGARRRLRRVAWVTRAQRAHRRLNFRARLARNRKARHQQRWQITLHGLPRPIIDYLAISNIYESTA